MGRHPERNILQGKEEYYNSDVRLVNNSLVVWESLAVKMPGGGRTSQMLWCALQTDKEAVWPPMTQVQKGPCPFHGWWVGRKATSSKFIQGFTELFFKKVYFLERLKAKAWNGTVHMDYEKIFQNRSQELWPYMEARYTCREYLQTQASPHHQKQRSL